MAPRSPTVVPPFGALTVDPVGATVVLGLVPTADDTSAPLGLRVAYSVPNQPSLIGTSIYSQALLLTDRMTTISNLVADVVH